jgi:hypothetical protein
MTLTINCPKGGKPLTVVRVEHEIEILACAVHGVFHFGPNRDVQPGLPPRR